MKTLFTSDLHLGDSREVMLRPYKSDIENDLQILRNLENFIEDGDVVFFVGDVFYKITSLNEKMFKRLRDKFPRSKFKLVKGNYDLPLLDTHIYQSCFDEVGDKFYFTVKDEWYTQNQVQIYLNHYPVKCKKFLQQATTATTCVTGHIHGLWKVNRVSEENPMINVSVDVHHMKPVSMQQIMYLRNACLFHYDENVFITEDHGN